MKLSDYVADFIAGLGIKHVFLYSGGAIVHTVDSISRHPDMRFIVPQHEQGGAAAADAYSRISGNIGVMLSTSGPGATNMITSICNAYFDSIPVLLISGQVATFRIKKSKKLRQCGFQETDVVSIFKPVTKYAVQVKRKEDVRYELEKAVYLAKSGRPGPVLIDLPDDLQREDIDPKKLRPFLPPSDKPSRGLAGKVKKLVSMLGKAERPVLILGAGIRVSNTEREAVAFSRYFKLPTLLTWGAMDLLPYDDPLNMGGLGVCGPRGGNFAAQTSDLVIALGTRLSSMITGGKQDLFAPKAKKAMVDLDPEEFRKFGKDTVVINLAIQADLKDFFREMRKYYRKSLSDNWSAWRKQIKIWTEKYPICLPEYYKSPRQINAHVFFDILSKHLKENDVILTDAGGNLSWTLQAFKVKKCQRLFSAWNHSPMGYSVPASIGAALAGGKEVYTITGDGGLMMCIEELGTIRKHDLPVKIFIFNNHGHGIQKQTMDTWLGSCYTAVDEATGLWFPDYRKTADVFGMPYLRMEKHVDILPVLKKAINTKGPVLVDVEIVPDQKIIPMLKFGAGLEDLDPKLPRKEIEEIMNVSQK